MLKIERKFVKLGLFLVVTLLFLAMAIPGFRKPAIANKPTNTAGQVTSVSQLGVSPTDPSYQALQSLVERYGCYTAKSFQGDRPVTQAQFVQVLNACLDRMSELIASATQKQ